MKTREELEQIAWHSIRTARVQPSPPKGLALSGRPKNYTEMAEMIAEGATLERAWGEFLHEFYDHRTVDFFLDPPSRMFSPGRRAILAGAAEYLSIEFGLPVPAWVHDPEYVLPELWDPWEEITPDIVEFREQRKKRSHPIFLKRNIIYESRNLIAL